MKSEAITSTAALVNFLVPLRNWFPKMSVPNVSSRRFRGHKSFMSSHIREPAAYFARVAWNRHSRKVRHTFSSVLTRYRNLNPRRFVWKLVSSEICLVPRWVLFESCFSLWYNTCRATSSFRDFRWPRNRQNSAYWKRLCNL